MSDFVFLSGESAEDYLIRRNALFEKEIEEARTYAVPGKEVTILNKKHSNPAARSNTYPVESTRIKRVINRIIEMQNGLTCTMTEFALYLRNPRNPIGG